ncbi:MAG TPA: aldo/keto reductase, partial [Armatimonadota bacterium]|nr:aldo/keto reductase [Armatimonadota bacterium]
RYVGFSFHDDIECFKRILDARDWDFCQIQYNYMDEQIQAGTEGLLYAADRGVGVVVMEPLRGGKLADPLPEDLEAERRRLGIEFSPAQLGLRWVMDHPQVAVTLSGMNAMTQLEENLAAAEQTPPGSLTDDERRLIAAIRDYYRQALKVDCTGCRYCMPCPHGVNIARTFGLYNDMSLYGDPARARMFYTKSTNPDEWASHCAECGQCEERCPQDIEIIEKLKEAHAALTAENG